MAPIRFKGSKALFTREKQYAGASLEDRTLIDMLATAIDVIIPFRAYEDVYEVGEIWLAPDARRRGEGIGDLLNQQ